MNWARFNSIPFDVLTLTTAPSSLTQLLQQILSLIVAGGFFRPSQAFLTLDPDPWPSMSGPFVSVHPGSHSLIPGQWNGASASLAGYRGRIPIRIADQCLIDYHDRDDVAVLRVNQGLTDMALQLSEYLTGEEASSKLTAKGIVQSPLSPISLSEPRRRKGDGRWRCVTLEVSVDWTHSYQTGMS